MYDQPNPFVTTPEQNDINECRLCPSCGYGQSLKGCETPGCLDSIYMTDEVRERIKRETAERIEREKIAAIRNRCFSAR